MIIYHLVWDLVYIYGKNWTWYLSERAYLWQQSICWIFILLSGFCWSLGSKKLKRGLLVFSAGLLVSVVTMFLPGDQTIRFGVLTLLGSCMLLMLPLEKLLRRVYPVPGLLLSAALFFLFRNVNNGYLGFEKWNLVKLPDFLYQNKFTAYLGFTPSDFSSADYFSLLPWLLLFITGYFLFRILNQNKKILLLLKKSRSIPGVEWMGRNSLLIYILHQPVIYMILLFYS